MLVARTTIIAKTGKTGEVAQLVKAELERVTPPRTLRIYTGSYTASNEVISEIEFESLAEMEGFFDEWLSTPEGLNYMKTMDELRVGSYNTEIRRLME